MRGSTPTPNLRAQRALEVIFYLVPTHGWPVYLHYVQHYILESVASPQFHLRPSLPILQMRKLKTTEAKSPAQGHPCSLWLPESRILFSHRLVLFAILFAHRTSIVGLLYFRLTHPLKTNDSIEIILSLKFQLQLVSQIGLPQNETWREWPMRPVHFDGVGERKT